MKPDERDLLLAFAWAGGGSPKDRGGRRVTLRTLGAEHRIPDKRVLYLAEKWADKGWYDYGVCADLGWLTEEGFEKAKSLDTIELRRLCREAAAGSDEPLESIPDVALSVLALAREGHNYRAVWSRVAQMLGEVVAAREGAPDA